MALANRRQRSRHWRRRHRHRRTRRRQHSGSRPWPRRSFPVTPTPPRSPYSRRHDHPGRHAQKLRKRHLRRRNPLRQTGVARSQPRHRPPSRPRRPPRTEKRLPEGFRTPDPAVDLAIIHSTQRNFYTTAGQMQPGAPELLKRYLDATLPAVRDAKLDLASY